MREALNNQHFPNINFHTRVKHGPNSISNAHPSTIITRSSFHTIVSISNVKKHKSSFQFLILFVEFVITPKMRCIRCATCDFLLKQRQLMIMSQLERTMEKLLRDKKYMKYKFRAIFLVVDNCDLFTDVANSSCNYSMGCWTNLLK